MAYSLSAAQLAESRYAYDSAAALYRQALECLERLPGAQPRRRVEILTRLAPALVFAGSTVEALTVRRSAIELAAQVGDDDLLAGAITAWNVPTPWTNRSYRHIDHELVAIFERVLASGRLTPRQRCLVLCTLTRETSYEDPARTAPAAQEAVTLARSTGDPLLLASALLAETEVFLPDLHPREWDRIRVELREVAERNGLVVFALLADFFDLRAAGVRLDLETWQRKLVTIREVARQYQLRQAENVSLSLEAMFAHLTGDLAGAEAAYRRAHEKQRRVNGVDADAQLALALATLRLSEDRLGELVEQLRATHAAYPVAADALALTLAQSGAEDEARELLADPAPIVRDYLWTVWTTLRALAVAAVGDTAHAAELYAALLPHAGEVAGGGTSGFVLTPVARALGQLAALLGRAEDARVHFAQAAEVARRCGSAPWLGQVERDAALFVPVRS